jgi:hypothetical protein
MTVEEAEFPMTFSGSGQCPCGEELDHMHLLWRFGTQQAAVVGVCCDCFRSAPPYAWWYHFAQQGPRPWVRIPEA